MSYFGMAILKVKWLRLVRFIVQCFQRVDGKMKNCCTNSQNEAGFKHNPNECAEGVSGSLEDSVGEFAADSLLRTAEEKNEWKPEKGSEERCYKTLVLTEQGILHTVRSGVLFPATRKEMFKCWRKLKQYNYIKFS